MHTRLLNTGIDTESRQDEDEGAFLSRYSFFPFLLGVTPHDQYQIDGDNASCEESALYQKNIDREIGQFKKELQSIQAETLFIFGVGLGHYYFAAKEWLDQHEDRELVFLEHDLGVIAAALEYGKLDEIFADNRVHLCFCLEQKNVKAFVEEVASMFPSESIGVSALASYKKRYLSHFQSLKQKLVHRSVIAFSHKQESLYYQYLVKNMLPNFLQLDQAFTPHKMKGAFQGVPAVISGAGPSLKEALPLLSQIKEQALLFAGGSSIIALEAGGASPHMGFAIDPNPEEYVRLRETRHMDLPLIFGSRLQPDVFSLLGGPIGYVKTATGGPFEFWMEEQLGIEGDFLLDETNSEALSVTIIALKTALLLGCDPIIFIGLDLAFQKQERYCKGVLPSMELALEKDRLFLRTSEMSITKKGRKSQRVETAHKWVMEGKCIEGIIAQNHDRTFLDATGYGLAIRGAKEISLEEFEKRLQGKKYPLETWLSAEMLQARLPYSKEEIKKHLSKLKTSLEKCREILGEMMEFLKRECSSFEETKILILEMDLEKEVAYTLFIEHLYSYLFAHVEKKGRQYQTEGNVEQEKKKAVWMKVQNVISEYLKTFESYGVE